MSSLLISSEIEVNTTELPEPLYLNILVVQLHCVLLSVKTGVHSFAETENINYRKP